MTSNLNLTSDGMEIKFNEAPLLKPSMQIATSDLALDHLWIIYPGNEPYPITEKISTLPLWKLEKIREWLE